MADWYVQVAGGQATGPFPDAAVLQGIAQGHLTADTRVCPAGSQVWVPMSEVAAFVPALVQKAAGGRASAPAGPSQHGYARSSHPSLASAPVSQGHPSSNPAMRPMMQPGASPSMAAERPAGRSMPPTQLPAAAQRSQKFATQAVAGLADAPISAPRPRTMFGAIQLDDLTGLAQQRQAIVGRAPPADVVLPYPQVSMRHASVGRGADGSIVVTDLGSTNGTHVAGRRIAPGESVKIAQGERIFIGPYAMILAVEGGQIRAYVEQEKAEWSGNQVEIEALDLLLQVPDRENPRVQKTLLNHITFKALPGDLIALMGPSGAGKTTLLTVLNGYLRPTGGEVRVNGESLYAIYDALRGSIGYVPQDDIVHPELTVWEAIKYSAQFRLPPDFSDEEITRRVDQVVKDLGLEPVKNLEIGKPERKVLSGGQRKRVNIALELVTDPALLFLDEPTSGLAADDTVALITLLSDLAKKQGKTILVTIHQPAREEYEKFNVALILGYGGEPVYFGPTGKPSYDFFGHYVAHKAPRSGAQDGKGVAIDNPRDMFDLLRMREDDAIAAHQFPDKAAARLAAAQSWRLEFFQDANPVYREMYSGKRQPGTPSGSRTAGRAKVPLLRQFGLLIGRYAIIKRRDVAGTLILLAQAPIIGVLLAAVFYNPIKTPNLWCKAHLQGIEAAALHKGAALTAVCVNDVVRFPKVADFSGALFFLSIAAIWFGTSNAAREIVSELAIYRRERMVNLSIFNYVLSKFTLLAGLCVVQCTVLLGIVFFALGLGNGELGSFAWMLFYMIQTSVTAVAIGLLLSTIVVSTEAAMALTPIALIPQVVLGGRMVPMTNKGWLEWVMALTPSRWAFEGLVATERNAIAAHWKIRSCVTTGAGIANGMFNCAVEEVRNATAGEGGLGFTTQDRPIVSILVLGAMMVTSLAAVMVLLRRRDSV